MNCKFKDEYESKKHKLVEKYIMTMKLYRLYLERELSRSGVFRSQHQMLMFISRFPNASQKDIANHQHVSTATIAVSLKKLEKGGYIKRVVDEEDNRFNQICITEKGKEIVDGGIEVFQRAEQVLFEGFTDEEIQTLDGFMERTRLNVEHLLQESSFENKWSKPEKLCDEESGEPGSVKAGRDGEPENAKAGRSGEPENEKAGRSGEPI